MKQIKSPTVGFVGWNPFQLLHVRNLIRAMPGAIFILESRNNNIDEFDAALLDDPTVPVIVWEKGEIDQLDGVFDVLVFQTPFNKIHLINRSKVAMIQYGYAKEAHNYGGWRAFADLNLVYGEYAARRISHFSPVAAVGNPRFDDWFKPEWREEQIHAFSPLNRSDRPTVLYAPTWGDLSSVDRYLDAVCALSDEFNVLLKMHHNTDLLEGHRKKAIARENIHSFGANVDLFQLLAVTDLFISDYSGAIFDALFCKKPIVLLDLAVDHIMGKKLDSYSIEFSQRDTLGLRAASQSELRLKVHDALSRKTLEPATDSIRSDLFMDQPGATERAVRELNSLADGGYERSQMQTYMRAEMERLYRYQLEVSILKRSAKKVNAAK